MLILSCLTVLALSGQPTQQPTTPLLVPAEGVSDGNFVIFDTAGTAYLGNFEEASENPNGYWTVGTQKSTLTLFHWEPLIDSKTPSFAMVIDRKQLDSKKSFYVQYLTRIGGQSHVYCEKAP